MTSPASPMMAEGAWYFFPPAIFLPVLSAAAWAGASQRRMRSLTWGYPAGTAERHIRASPTARSTGERPVTAGYKRFRQIFRPTPTADGEAISAQIGKLFARIGCSREHFTPTATLAAFTNMSLALLPLRGSGRHRVQHSLPTMRVWPKFAQCRATVATYSFAVGLSPRAINHIVFSCEQPTAAKPSPTLRVSNASTLSGSENRPRAVITRLSILPDSTGINGESIARPAVSLRGT